MTQMQPIRMILFQISKISTSQNWSFKSQNQIKVKISFFFLRNSPVGHGLLIHMVSRAHSTTHHSRLDSSGRVISSLQRPLPDNAQHSQQTDIHAAGGIRTHNLSRRAAAGPPLRPRRHWGSGHILSTNVFSLIF